MIESVQPNATLKSVTIVGGGNVATHLFKALQGKFNVVIANPRTLENMPSFSDIVIISVKDDAIAEVAKKIKSCADIIAHTSGSVPMSVLAGLAKGWGVFYPLQTFTKGVELNYREIPFFIEGDSRKTEESLVKLAGEISDEIHKAGSEERKRLHLASVFACNFTNCLMGISKDILDESGISFRVMLPLLRQSISKLSVLNPDEAQTGPAARKDIAVINSHLDMLSEKPELQDIYRSMSDLILKKTGK